jgi:hypothetical protein
MAVITISAPVGGQVHDDVGHVVTSRPCSHQPDTKITFRFA